MRKFGYYGIYKNKEFRISELGKRKITLASEDEKDVIFGFKLKTYPKNHLLYGRKVNVYIKHIKMKNLDRLYNYQTKAKYEGDIFHMFGGNDEICCIETSDRILAEKHGFVWSYSLGYSAEIKKDQCQVMEVRTDVNMLNMQESNERISILNTDD